MRSPSIIGREADVAAVIDHLANARTVTVLGTGGVGKTTLARSVAARLPSGAAWVDLAALAAESDVVAAAVRTLGASSLEGWAVAQIEPAPLVVLDNCEHVLAGANDLAEQLARSHDGVRLLLTSRVELGLEDEIRYRLAPLSVSSSGDSMSPAAELFVGRCRSAGATWPDSPANLDAIDSIVRRVEGLPLAIELAAAQTVAISPAQFAALITPSLDALSEPTTDGTTGLREVIESSYLRLQPETQRFFRAIALLGGAFELDVTASLAAVEPLAALNLIGKLLGESLIAVEHEDDGASRFRLLEPVREFALEQLADADEVDVVENRFLDTMAEFADDVVANAVGEFDVSLLAAAIPRFPLLVRAIETALRRDESPGRAYRMFLPLFTPSSGPRRDIGALGTRVHQRWPEADDPLRAVALAVIAHTVMTAGDDATAVELAEAALDEPGASALGKALALRTLASVAAYADDYETATAHFEMAIAEAERLGGLFAREMKGTMLGFRIEDTASLGPLAALCDEAAAADDDMSLGWLLVAMMNIQLRNGQLDDARRHLDRAEIAAARSPLRWSQSSVARSRAIIESASLDWPASAAAWSHCLELMVRWGDADGIGVCILTAAASAEHCGERDLAEALWRCRPTTRTNTILQRPFVEEEERLAERCGEPVPLNLGEAVARSRPLLAGATTAEPLSSPSDGHAVLRFGAGFELDLGRIELRRAGDVIHVEPQVFDVLAHLASNAGRMVSREELMDAVWSTRFVSAAAVSSRIRSARAAVDDDGRRQAVIRTVHGRGFEFVAEVASA